MAYKLIGAKDGETPDEAIIRCANNLVKAVMAAGYSIHETGHASGLNIDFYDAHPGEMYVQNIISNWVVRGKTPLKITFCAHPKAVAAMNDLTPDE